MLGKHMLLSLVVMRDWYTPQQALTTLRTIQCEGSKHKAAIARLSKVMPVRAEDDITLSMGHFQVTVVVSAGSD